MVDQTEEERLQELLAHRFVQLMTQTAIKQKLAIDRVAEAMLVDAIAILANVDGPAGRQNLAALLRRTADSVEKPPQVAGSA